MSVSRFIRAASPSLNLDGWRVGPSGPQGSVRKTGKLSKRARKPRPLVPTPTDWSTAPPTSSASRSTSSVDSASTSSISSSSSTSSSGSADSRPRFRGLRFFRRKQPDSNPDTTANRATIASFCNASTCSIDSIPEVPVIRTTKTEKRRTIRPTASTNLDKLCLDLEVAHHREMMAVYPPLRTSQFGRALDIGCGVGLWVLDMAHMWTDTHFVGFDTQPRQFGLESVEASVRERIRWAHGDWATLPFSDEEFDFVRVSFIAQRVTADQWDSLFTAIRRVLRRGGTLEIVDEDLTFPTVALDSNPHSHPGLLKHLFESHLSRRNVHCKVSETLPQLLNQHFPSAAGSAQATVRAVLRRPTVTTTSAASDGLWDDPSGVGPRSKRLALPPEFFERHWAVPAVRHLSVRPHISTAPSMISLPDFCVYEPEALNCLFENPLPTAFSFKPDLYDSVDDYDADDQDSDYSLAGDTLISPESPDFPETPRDGTFDDAGQGPALVVPSGHSTFDRRILEDGSSVRRTRYFTHDLEDRDAVDFLDIPVVLSPPLAAAAHTRVAPSISSLRSVDRLSQISCLTTDDEDTTDGATAVFRAARSPYRPTSAAARLGWDAKSHRALLRVLSLRQEMFNELQRQLGDRRARQNLETLYGWRKDRPCTRGDFDAMVEAFVGRLFGQAGRTVAWARTEDSGCASSNFVLRWSRFRDK